MSTSSPELTPCEKPKRKQIVLGAALVFERFGYDGASMSRIADEAGVSKGTLYNYFVSKSELFEAFVEETTLHRLAWILEPDRDGGGPEATLRVIARRLIETILSPVAQTMHRIVLSETGKFPHLARIFYEAVHQRVRNDLAARLARESEAGRMRVDDATLAAEQFIALCRTRLWIRRCLNQDGGTVREAEIDTIVAATVTMFLNTYRPSPEVSTT